MATGVPGSTFPNPVTTGQIITPQHFADASATDSIFGTYQAVTWNASLTFNAALGSLITVVMTGNTTSWTISGGFNGQIITIRFIQDGTGGRTIIGANAIVHLSGGAIALTATANKTDALVLCYTPLPTAPHWIELSRSLNQ